ncbi:sigma-70 family RNA polymerase sigma factor [Neorhizobium sp. NCHU2750]|uniref:RNA polymerase sigma factor n=1 Tax=Neorhizobium sp. NCHU2750 TaxID=1825976 RepID=UPI000E70C31A
MVRPLATRHEEIESLYIAERSRLERLAGRKVGHANAADVVQDVFTSIWSKAREHVILTPAYLVRATGYAAISQFRTDRRHERILADLTEEQYSPPVIMPDQIVSARQELQRLQDAIDGLPERTRKIFLLNRVHNCSYDEIAFALDLSYSTVEREIAKAILACKAVG